VVNERLTHTVNGLKFSKNCRSERCCTATWGGFFLRDCCGATNVPARAAGGSAVLGAAVAPRASEST
jgi:hypothetical protein